MLCLNSVGKDTIGGASEALWREQKFNGEGKGREWNNGVIEECNFHYHCWIQWYNKLYPTLHSIFPKKQASPNWLLGLYDLKLYNTTQGNTKKNNLRFVI